MIGNVEYAILLAVLVITAIMAAMILSPPLAELWDSLIWGRR